jgi:hypothetical protein
MLGDRPVPNPAQGSQCLAVRAPSSYPTSRWRPQR